MTDPWFFDTNILVYAVGSHAGDPRCEIAARLVRQARDDGRFRLSTQVLQELYVTLTRSVQSRFTPPEILRFVEAFAMVAPVTAPAFPDIRAAILLSHSAKISYWDALIVTTARTAGCRILYTEDLNHNQVLDGVRVVNPFR